MSMTQKIQVPSNFSHFLIPATLLNLTIFLFIAVVILWFLSLLLLTRHCLLSSLTLDHISQSDHFPILCELNIQPLSPPLSKVTSFRCIDAIRIPHFLRDNFPLISSAILYLNSLSDLIDCCNLLHTHVVY
jgi:hypothetical protein